MGVKELFEPLASAVQQKHQHYFDSLSSDQENFKSIHGHFYLFSGNSGTQLRFQSNSQLPENIKTDLQYAFDEFNEHLKDNKTN